MTSGCVLPLGIFKSLAENTTLELVNGLNPQDVPDDQLGLGSMRALGRSFRWGEVLFLEDTLSGRCSKETE